MKISKLERFCWMKVSKTVSVDLELLQNVLKHEKRISKAVEEALRLWLDVVSSDLHKGMVVMDEKKRVSATVYVRRDEVVEENARYVFNLPEVKSLLKKRNLQILENLHKD